MNLGPKAKMKNEVKLDVVFMVDCAHCKTTLYTKCDTADEYMQDCILSRLRFDFIVESTRTPPTSFIFIPVSPAYFKDGYIAFCSKECEQKELWNKLFRILSAKVSFNLGGYD